MTVEETKNEFLIKTKELTNEKLLLDYIDISGGDDYDGCFTTMGVFKLEVLYKELESRLINCGFLNKPIT